MQLLLCLTFLDVQLIETGSIFSNDSQNASIECRKKRKFNNTDKKEVKLRKDKARFKHSRRPLTCPVKCRNKCSERLPFEHQKYLWETYWSLTYVEKRQFLAKCVSVISVKRRTTVEVSTNNFKKSQSRIYMLPDTCKNEVQICKTTLLNILGYTNDSVITELVKNMNSDFCLSSVTKYRGKQNIKKCKSKDIIIDHIRSYNPAVSHYRRLNSPNVMYLPSGLTVKAMYDNFCLTYKDYCSQEFYRTVIKELNISLRNSSIDKCEDCCIYQNIIQNSSNENEIKDTEKLLEIHKS